MTTSSKKKSRGFYIFRASITVNGVTIYAKDRGKRAFKIWISLDK